PKSVQIKAEYNQPFEMKPVKKSGNAPWVRVASSVDSNGLLFAQPSLNRCDCSASTSHWIEAHLHQLQVRVGVLPEIVHEPREIEDPHIFELSVTLVTGTA